MAHYRVEDSGPSLHIRSSSARLQAGVTGAVLLNSFRTWLVCECSVSGERIPTGLRAPIPQTAHILKAFRGAMADEVLRITA